MPKRRCELLPVGTTCCNHCKFSKAVRLNKKRNFVQVKNKIMYANHRDVIGYR